MGSRIITERENSDPRDLVWEKGCEPGNAIIGSECFLPMSIQTMNSNDAVWVRSLDIKFFLG